MTDLLDRPAIDKEIEALIDRSISEMSGRSIVPVSEMIDLLLDLRHMTGRLSETARRAIELWWTLGQRHVEHDWCYVQKGWAALTVDATTELVGRYDGRTWTVWRDEGEGTTPVLIGEGLDKQALRGMRAKGA